MNKAFKYTVYLFLCFSLGIAIVYQQNPNLVDATIERDPASIHDQSRISSIHNISPDDLKAEISKNISLHDDKESKVIVLNGFSEAICHQYQNVQLTFIAHGVLVSGEVPKITESVPCETQFKNGVVSLKLPKSVFAKSEFSDANAWILDRMDFSSESGTKKKIIKLDGAKSSNPVIIENNF